MTDQKFEFLIRRTSDKGIAVEVVDQEKAKLVEDMNAELGGDFEIEVLDIKSVED